MLPAAAVAVAPATAQGPGHGWVSLCTSEGLRLVPVSGSGIPGRGDDERGERMCAHATCPREIRAGGKSRGLV